MNPITPDKKRRKLFYEIWFATITVIGVALIIWQGARSLTAQQENAVQQSNANHRITEQTRKIDVLNAKVDSLGNQVFIRDSQLALQGEKQITLAQREFERENEPIIHIKYEKATFSWLNGSHNSLLFYGMKVGDELDTLNVHPYLCNPLIWVSNNFEPWDRNTRIRIQREHLKSLDVPVKIYFMDGLRRKFTANYTMHVATDSTELAVSIYNLPLSKEDWPKEIIVR